MINDAKNIYVCAYVVLKVAESFKPHYFQLAMTDLLDILSKSEYYLIGLGHEELKYVYREHICNKGKFQTPSLASFNSSKAVLESSSDLFEKEFFDEFFITTIENFIEHEKRKFEF